MMQDTLAGSKSPLYLALHRPAPYKSALAERLAKLKAQSAAATIGLDSVIKATADSDVKKPAPVPHKKDSSGGATHTPVKAAPPPDSSIHKDSTR